MSASSPALAGRRAQDRGDVQGRSVPLARVTPPDLSHIVPRTRLLDAIDAARARMVWIAGLAGSGKTTLAADYARHTGAPVVWLRLDGQDEDPAGYFLHLSAAADAAGVARGGALPVLSVDRLGALEAYAREFFAALFKAVGERCVVVHDDVHHLDPAGAMAGVLAALLDEAPPRARLVMTGREGPPPALARGVANGDVWVMPGERLAMTEDETRRLVQRWATPPTPAGIATLHRHTQGWAGGLALLGAGGGPDGHDAQRLLAGYFECEVLDGLDDAQRDALTRIAWLPAVRVDLARAVAGSGAACEVLDDLARRGLFVSTHVGPRPEFALHALFTEHLQRRARETLPDEEVRAIQVASADALRGEGDVAPAVALYLEAGAHAEAAAAIGEAAPAMFREARLRTLREWVQTLSPDARLADPWLDYWLAMCVLMTDPAGGRELMHVAYRGFRERGDERGRVLALSYLIGSYFMSYSSTHPLRAWVDEIGALGEQFDALPDADTRASAALGVWYGLFLVEPDHPDLALWESRLTAILRQPVNPTTKLRIGMILSKHYYYTGRYAKIWPLRPLLLAESRDAALSPYGRLLWFLYSLPDCWSRGDFDEARRELERALAEASRSGIHLLDNHCILHTAAACLLDGALDEAAALLDRVPPASASTRHMEMWHLYLNRSWHSCLEGRHVEAAEHAALCGMAARDMGGVAPQCLAIVAQAWIATARGRADDAARLLAELEPLAARSGSDLVHFHARLVAARLALHAGERARSAALLRDALAIGRELGLLHFQWAVPELLAPLAHLALEQGMEVDYVRALVRARHMHTLPAPAHIEAWPWQVTIRTLGRFEVLLDGEPLAQTGKAQTRTLALLKAILAFGAEQVGSATLCDALWPDADGDAAHHALESALYRLRKLIGKEAVTVRDGKVSLCWTRCWWDARALQHLASAVPDGGERRRLASAICRGPFLAADADLAFAVPARERFAAIAQDLLG